MKSFFLSLLLFFVVSSESSATALLGFGDSELRFRGKISSFQKEESTLLVEEKNPRGDEILMKTPKGVEITREEDKVLSFLGEVWNDFKEGKDSARNEFVRLGLMLDEPDPKALYLLGKVSGTLGNKTRYHTNALILSEEGSPLYHLILKAYQECQAEALRRAQERNR